MNKTWLIIKREYLTRVRSRTFLLSTILTPLFFAGLIFTVSYLTARNAGEAAPGIAGNILTSPPSGNEGGKGLAYGIGYASSFAIYIIILIYGTMVMRGVSEEKTNRVAEVIISSVKPFQLMMGKIVGIGAVGLTQFLIWIILLLMFSAGLFLLAPAQFLQQAGAESNAVSFSLSTAGVNLPLIIFCFVFYFLFGYLFYASLFAAVGSAVNEDAQDNQGLLLPVTMPIVLAIVIMMNAISDPTSALAIGASLIPFFSPVVMMARIPFGVPAVVPWWELALSMLLLLSGFLLTTWVSAKIYRTGILMYGKKTNWREMWRWIFRS